MPVVVLTSPPVLVPAALPTPAPNTTSPEVLLMPWLMIKSPAWAVTLTPCAALMPLKVEPSISAKLPTVKAPVVASMLTLPPVDLAATVTALASVTY